MRRDGSRLGISPVIGSVVLVAITMILGTVAITYLTGIAQVQEDARAGVSVEHQPDAERVVVTYVSGGNADTVDVRFDGLDADGHLRDVGDTIVLDFADEELRFSGSASTTVPGNITVTETVSDPSPLCGSISESEQESNDEQESQNDAVYDYVYTYEYDYTYGDYEYTYHWRYEWTGEPDPNPDPQPHPPGAGGYCPNTSGLDPDPDPNPDPDPSPGDVYAGDGPTRSEVSHAVGIDANVSRIDVALIARKGESATFLYSETIDRSSGQ